MDREDSSRQYHRTLLDKEFIQVDGWKGFVVETVVKLIQTNKKYPGFLGERLFSNQRCPTSEISVERRVIYKPQVNALHHNGMRHKGVRWRWVQALDEEPQ